MSSYNGIIADLPQVEYGRMLAIQRRLNALRNDGLIPDMLIMLTHPHVYTTGIHRNPDEILDSSIEVFQVERGGSATYHGPGQLVSYFMVNLKDRGINIRDLIIAVEDAIVSLLNDYGISADGRLHGETGVWVGNRKICSVGLAVRGFSTLHGIALNVSTDLSRFSAIMPCGMPSQIMTSMEQELGRSQDIGKVRSGMIERLVASLGLSNSRIIRNIDEIEELSVGNGL